MNLIHFITGNKNKFREISSILAPIKIKQLDVNLDEIQSLDPKRIIEHKLNEAFKHHKGPFIIEDTSTTIEAFGKRLPGPFIKFFLENLGTTNIAKIAIKMKKQNAVGSVVIAYAKNPKNVKFFFGKIIGKIVMPKGNYGFGYDEIFQPRGSKLTLGQTKVNNNFSKSARGIATLNLRKYLLKHL